MRCCVRSHPIGMFLLAMGCFILVTLPNPLHVRADGSVCQMKTDYDPTIPCSLKTVVVRNDAELDAYLIDYGLKRKKYRNLKIAYDINRPIIEIHSPCRIRLKDNVALTGDSVCLDGRKGVEDDDGYTVNALGAVNVLSEQGNADFGYGSIITADQLTMEAHKIAKIGINSQVNVNGAVRVRSTGNLLISQAIIRQGTTLNAGHLIVEAVRGAIIANNVHVQAQGDVAVQSTGNLIGSTAIIEKDATISADNITVEAPREAAIGVNVSLAATGDVTVRSTGDTFTSNALLRKNVVIHAQNLLLEAPRLATVGNSAIIDVNGDAILRSLGQYYTSLAKLNYRSQVSANSLDMTSGFKTTLGFDTYVNTFENFNMAAVTPNKCTIADSAVISAGSTSGNCLEEGVLTVPQVTGLLLPEAEIAIANAGLILGPVTGENRMTMQTDRVFAQTPLSNTNVLEGTEVSLGVVLPPPVGETIPSSWEGLWEIGVLYIDPTDNTILGKETMTNTVCTGDPLGLALTEQVAYNLPEVNQMDCTASATDSQIDATCVVDIMFLGICPLTAVMQFEMNLNGDQITGYGQFNADSICNLSKEQTYEITGTRLGSDENGLCERPESSLIQKFLRHPLKSIGGSL
jgi:hypothetical protein